MTIDDVLSRRAFGRDRIPPALQEKGIARLRGDSPGLLHKRHGSVDARKLAHCLGFRQVVDFHAQEQFGDDAQPEEPRKKKSPEPRGSGPSSGRLANGAEEILKRVSHSTAFDLPLEHASRAAWEAPLCAGVSWRSVWRVPL